MTSLKQQISDWELAKFLHEHYEKYAEQQGWETQKECKVAFENLPEKNKSVMLLVSVQVKKFVLGLLADYKCIATKQLEEKIKRIYADGRSPLEVAEVLEDLLKGKLLEDSK